MIMTKATYTYVSALAEAIEIVSKIEGKEELIEKLETLKGIKEREGKRKSDKPTKKELEAQAERERIADAVLKLEIPAEGYRPCEIAKAVGVSTSKISGILSALAEDGKLIREDKASYKDTKGHSAKGLKYKPVKAEETEGV